VHIFPQERVWNVIWLLAKDWRVSRIKVRDPRIEAEHALLSGRPDRLWPTLAHEVTVKADYVCRKVSFLSRFIGGNKKKSTLDGASDNGSEADDLRREGMDAQLYVDNFSFSPKIPHPPAYIKVRAKFKKEKEFDRVFLAQELRSGSDKHSPPAAGSNPAPQSGSAATQNPIWAVEFSKDGKYLAVGGQDRVIRVWTVIDSAEGRRAHENAESDPHAQLSAPVFQQKPIREYQGHASTILDLSWSKVCRACLKHQ
jgi:WD40 repeat protein